MGQTVGFIGLGIMGSRMVKNVLKAGYAVRAQNRTAAKAEALKPLGATVVATPREAAAGAEVVVTMVADPPALAAVLEGPDGVFAGCRRGTLVVDMSTVDPGTSQAMAGKARALGLRYLEAPVTGGVGAAEQGTLTIMAGGSAEDFAAAKPLLETMGKKVLHVGPMGQGSVLKLCANLVAASIVTSMNEALVLAAKSGLDLGVVTEVLTERSPLIGADGPQGALGGLLGQFPPQAFSQGRAVGSLHGARCRHTDVCPRGRGTAPGRGDRQRIRRPGPDGHRADPGGDRRSSGA